MKPPADLGGLREARLHYRLWGRDGPRLVLLHPIGFSHDTWDEVAAGLEGKYRLLAPDLPGHGRSDKPVGGDYRLQHLAARCLLLMDDLGWEDAIWVGNSLGGGVALAAALQAPERARGLVLVNSVAFGRGLPAVGRLASLPGLPTVLRLTPRLAVRFGIRMVCFSWGDRFETGHRRACVYLRDPAGSRAFVSTLRRLYAGHLDTLAEQYRAIQAPALVIHGDRDPLIRLSHAAELARALNADLKVLPNCGHFPQDEQPRLLLRVMEPYLEDWSRR